MNGTASSIVECALRMIREGGYHSFSFRQIATELGVKSASIHYHFPTKEALGVALTQRYTCEFLEGLGDPDSHGKPLDFYIKAFQKSLVTHQSACVCGVLAAEAGRLPQPVREILEEFTAKNIQWLKKGLTKQFPEMALKKKSEAAAAIFSALEGAITFAALTDQPSHLDKVGRWIKDVVV